MKYKNLALPFIIIATNAANAATIFTAENFETNLGVWTANAVVNTGRYIHNGAFQPTGSTNHAPGGVAAASLGKSGGAITSSIADLSSGGVTETLTVNFDFHIINGTTTRRGFIQYSNDGGSNWFSLAMMQTGGGISNLTSNSASVTITEGSTSVTRSGTLKTPVGGTAYDGSQFGANSQFRLINNGSAGADFRIFTDNVEVTSSVTPVPEPTSAALLGFCSLALVFRRRRFPSSPTTY